jgi:hypothetical protein
VAYVLQGYYLKITKTETISSVDYRAQSTQGTCYFTSSYAVSIDRTADQWP